MGFSLNEFNGFLRSDFDEGLMGFWGLILVYGFLNFFFFLFFCVEFMGFSLNGV